MEKKMNNEELQSRREFFKKAAKAAIPVVGAVILANAPSIVKASESTSCDYTCSYSCEGKCVRTCTGCDRSCKDGCYHGCQGSCDNSCSGSCKGSSH